MKRHNHYEAAFEAYLRDERLPYVAVNEQRRALAPGRSLKSVDFIVSPPNDGSADAPRWLIDVKGRAFPSGSQLWRNWATDDDLRSLADWRRRFSGGLGGGFDAAFVFAYWLTADRSPTPPEQVFYHRDRPYAFVAVTLDDYAAAARRLSARWKTVAAPAAAFRALASPALEFFHPSAAGTRAAEAGPGCVGGLR